MKRHIEETIFRILMVLSLLVVAASLVGVLLVVLVKGVPVLSWGMVTRASSSGFGGEESGILNAILGSLCLGLGATGLAFVLSLPIAFYLQRDYGGRSRLAALARLALDVLWGIPSIVYGAFGLVIMLYLGMRASLLAGTIALTFVELPIMTRAMDEVLRLVPQELKEASYSLGGTRLETTTRVVFRQCLPGIVTAVLLAFGRGIGDAAAVFLTAGYTENLPVSLVEPVASLPVAVFMDLQNAFPEVQQQAYAAGAVLLVIVLAVSAVSRLLVQRFERHVVR